MDKQGIQNQAAGKKKWFIHENGITYFDKKLERTFFFILTIIILVCGIFTGGVWN